MKIRIISDLHIDLNCQYPLSLRNKNIFTIIAGDISGHPEYSKKWIDANIKNGLFIAGNHIVYNNKSKTLPEWKEYLKEQYPLNNNVSFLENQYKEIDGKIFIGCTLYTDYEFSKDIESSKMVAEKRMNDFRYGTIKENNKKRNLTPDDYLKWHKESLKFIKKIVKENENKDIIIITHHCPAAECILEKYRDNPTLNSSYVSSLENYIKKHNNIKCWICGHVHNRKHFKVGNCLIIQNPRGYESYGESYSWTPNFILDTDTWEITEKPYTNKEWEKQRKLDDLKWKVFEGLVF